MQFGSALRWVGVLSLCLYVGGAIVMELVLRYAQEDLPGPQTAVTCRVSGDRWKWVALAGLSLVGISGVTALAIRDPILPAELGWAYVAASSAAASCWIFLMWVLLKMSFGAHPALSLRPEPGMPEDEFQMTREALKRAIRRMDRLLRAELFVALGLTASAALVLQLY